MNRWTPLAYLASVGVLALVVTYAWAWQTYPRIRKHSWLLLGWPVQMVLWTTGKLLGIGAWIGKGLSHWAYALTELWGPKNVSRFFWGIRQNLDLYKRRQLEPARHAA